MSRIFPDKSRSLLTDQTHRQKYMVQTEVPHPNTNTILTFMQQLHQSTVGDENDNINIPDKVIQTNVNINNATTIHKNLHINNNETIHDNTMVPNNVGENTKTGVINMEAFCLCFRAINHNHNQVTSPPPQSKDDVSRLCATPRLFDVEL